MKELLISFIFTAFVFTSSYALNEYKPCIGCHGEKGEKSALNRSKIINQMTKQEILDALNGYRNNNYGGPMKGLMKVQVKRLTQEELELIADYIAKK